MNVLKVQIEAKSPYGKLQKQKRKKDAPKFKDQCQLCMGNVSAKPIS